LDVAGGNRAFVDLTQAPPAKADGAGSGVLKAPLDGAVIAVKAEIGDQVKKGQVLIVVEAMKMEHQIKADIDGKLKALHVKPGVQAKTRQILAEIEGD
jgi:geranyl-CoA carboxylase alpha subunit